MHSQDELFDIVSKFAFEGQANSITPYGSGHINDTYRVSCDDVAYRYILQRINHDLFKDVPGLMSNVERVCAHTKQQLLESNIDDVSRRVLTLVPGPQGASHYHSEDGSYWRMYWFIENATGHDIVQNEQQAYEAAKAFGLFQKLLSDLPGERLNETIPDFHDGRKRFAALEKALADNTADRAESCRAEINWAYSHKDLAGALMSLLEQGLIPERVTHNDTKLNNVLIDDDTDEAKCVIDLDTVMPGVALYDFGDLVRSSTSPAAEDETDLSKVYMQLNMYRALLRGYLESSGSFLTDAEVENLYLAGRVMTYIVGIRFLTDYLLGDTYFKTAYAEHNLVRCRTQFKLVDSMEEQESLMKDCADALKSVMS